MKRTAPNYSPLLKRYASYAPRYDRRFARYTQATLNKALEVIPMGEARSLLDVACGTGVLAQLLLERRPNLRITGVDISPQMLEQARCRIPEGQSVKWTTGHAEKLPVGDGAFDLITCTNAFHLVQDALAALREFRRVLRPGGTLVLVDWCLDFPQMRLLNAVQKVVDRQRRKVRHLDELLELIGRADFDVREAERFVPRALWGMMRIVAKKPGLWRAPSAEILNGRPARRTQPDDL